MSLIGFMVFDQGPGGCLGPHQGHTATCRAPMVGIKLFIAFGDACEGNSLQHRI